MQKERKAEEEEKRGESLWGSRSFPPLPVSVFVFALREMVGEGDGRGRGLFGSTQETKCISDVGIGASPEDAFFAAAFPDTALYLFVPNIYVYIACRHGGERYAPRLNVQC